MAVSELKIDLIRIDGGTQARAKIDQNTVDDYAALYEEKADLPPVVVFFDGTDHWLADGFHRLHGASKAGRKKLAVDSRRGTLDEAILYACGANSSHGLKRTNADKRKAVGMLLAKPEWAGKSNKWISETAIVSDDLVAALRKELEAAQHSETNVEKREGRDGKLRNPRKLTSKPAQEPSAEEPEPVTEPEPPTPEPEDEGGFEPNEALKRLKDAEAVIAKSTRLVEDVRKILPGQEDYLALWDLGNQKVKDAILALRQVAKRK